MSQAPTNEQLQAAFTKFDADKSGKISTKEIFTLLTQLGIKVTEADCHAAIQKFDKNGSGEMEFDEFKDLVNFALQH